MTSEDHWYAYRIPDDFVAASGDSISRISRIVTENWWQHGADSLAQLVEPLISILEPLKKQDAEITNEQREQCALAVERWLTNGQGDPVAQEAAGLRSSAPRATTSGALPRAIG